MQIEFQMSGGYANIRKTFTKNTDDLPLETRNELLDLIIKSGIMNLRQEDLKPFKSTPDVFNYKISLSDKSNKIILTLNDLLVSDRIRPMIERLKELAVRS